MDPEEAESREQQLLEDAFSYRTEKQYPEGATENRKRVIICYHLVSGHNPGHYVFDQRKMRKHLYKCLDKGHMEMFPHKEVQSHSKIASIDYIDVYCVCRMRKSMEWIWWNVASVLSVSS